MNDTVGVHRKKAIIPISSSAFILFFGVAICWNALNGQTDSRPAQLIEARKARSTSIPDLLARADEGAARPQGESGSKNVERMQRELADRKLYVGDVDGLQGPATREAMRVYREKHWLKAGEDEIRTVIEHMELNQRISEAARSSFGDADRLSNGTIGLIQTGLAELGYDPGVVDGRMGERTRQAIRDFQRDRSLEPTGAASSELLNELRKVTGLTSLGDT